jgi:hypothetical protein
VPPERQRASVACGKIAGVIRAVPKMWPVAVGAALAALAIGCVVSAAAAAPASGDAAALALERQAQTAMGAYQGISFTGGGTSYRVIHQAGGDTFKFYFGSVPKGFRAAVAHVRIVQRKGLVTEEVDTLVAAGEPPLRIWQSKGLEVGELVGSKSCPELIPTNPASFFTVGSPLVGVHGHYSPLAAATATTEVLASSYRLAGGTAHERDTIDTATHLWRASRFVVSGGPYNGNFLSESGFAFSRTQRFLAPPRLHTCE